MRVWKYYLDKSRLKVNEGVAFTTARERYALYAITNDKEKAKEFMDGITYVSTNSDKHYSFDKKSGVITAVNRKKRRSL